MEEPQAYAVLILKRDNNHIIVLETDNFEEAHKRWAELKDRWIDSLDEKTPKPFELEAPIITAFDPGLISEISIRPHATSKSINTQTTPHNPYSRRMINNGLSNTLQNPVLDEGYKY